MTRVILVSAKGPTSAAQNAAEMGHPHLVWFILLALFLFFLSPSFFSALGTQAFAQDYSGTADSAQDSSQTFTLSGSVVNSATGAPVTRALVTLYGARRRSVMSNAEGQFVFEGVTAGQMQVAAEKPGYFTEQEMRLRAEGNQGAMPEMVTVGRESPAITVKLIPESVIAGRITENGVGVEGVPVTAIATEIQDGFRQWAQRGNAVSDEDGEFRVPNLTAGEYYLEIGPKGPGTDGKGPQNGYGGVFYPGPPVAEGGSPLAVGVGQRAELEIGVKREPWFAVSGVVKTAEPGANWNIQLVNERGSAIMAAGARRSFETGEFEMRAPAGNYTLRAMTFSQGNSSVTDSPLAVHGDVAGVQVTVGAGFVVPVKVKTESTGTKAGGSGPAMVGFVNGRRVNAGGMPPASIYLRRTGEFEEGRNVFAAPDASGRTETLAMRGLASGNYWLEVNSNSPWYVAAAECGGVDLLREELTVTTGAPCAEIDVTLRDDGASLKVNGSWDGDPAAGTLLILPELAPQEVVVGQISKGDSFGYGNLAPGNYNVVLVDRAGGLEYRNPEAMAGYLSKAAHVTLGAGQESSVTVEMVRR